MILILAALTGTKLAKPTLELITAARQFSDDGEPDVTVLVLGSAIDAAANEAARYADQVLVADSPALAEYDPAIWAAAIATIAAEGEAKLILLPGTRGGRELAPRLAVRLEAPLLEDVITLKRSGSQIEAQRYTFLARVTESIATEAPVAVATIRPGAFAPASPLATPAEQYAVDVEPIPTRILRSDRQSEASAKVSLADAEIIVAGGRGLGSAEAFASLLIPLADTLGAAVGATRAVVDAGWRPYNEQIGQTGKTVQPKIYLAIGISGATQHLSGMNKSKLVIAINRDADAPIFSVADLGIVGDLAEILPALTAELDKRA